MRYKIHNVKIFFGNIKRIREKFAKINPRYLKKIILWRIFPVFSIVFAIYLSRNALEFFRIKKVIISSPVNDILGIGYLKGKLLPAFDENSFKKAILERNVLFEDVRIVRKFPDTVFIEIFLKKPVAVITSGGDKIYFSDKNGYLFPAEYDWTGLAELKMEGKIILDNEKPDWRISKAVSYIMKLGEKGLPVKYINVNGETENYDIFLKSGEKIKIPKLKQVATAADSLQIIISRFRIEGKLISSIDFSNNKPVVILRNEEKNYP